MDRGIGDLRLRIEASFSAAELRDLARKWSVAAEPGWDKSSSDYARGLLREAERSFGIGEVVRRLRLEKPLVEWPDVESGDAEKWGPPSVTQMGLGPAEAVAAPVAPTLHDEATLVGGPPAGALEADLGAAPASARSDLAPIDRRADAAPASSAFAGPPSSAAPQSAVPPSLAAPSSVVAPSSPFPGTVTPEPAKPATVDARLPIVLGAIMVGLAGLAFGAGFLWSRAPRSEAPAKAKTVVNPNGLAGRAASVLDAALLGVADRCEITVDGEPTVDILSYAQEGCGHGIRESRRRALADEGLTPSDGRPRPPDPATPDEPKPIRTPHPGGPSRPCISGCATGKAACMSDCGREPGDASKFDVWQACSGRCLAAESRCRLSCP